MAGKTEKFTKRNDFTLSSIEPWIEAVLLIGGACAVVSLFASSTVRHLIPLAPDHAAKLGELSAGLFGPIFSLIGVVLLVATLRQQRASIVQQGFANKYFILLEIHRENANQIRFHDVRGRRVFVLMVREIRSAIPYIRQLAEAHGKVFTQRQVLHIAYYCFFYGVGPNSSRTLTMALKRDFDGAFIDDVDRVLSDPVTKHEVKKLRDFDFEPFRGHQSRLGHYYRHLFQMVNYVDEQNSHLNKYDYVRTVRAQFSTHEQALLLLNSLTPLGRKWWSQKLITKYRLARNLPRNFFEKDTELDVEALFGKDYFEWQDRD